nr:hypothetical protein [Pseudomonadota bacterium]
ANPFGTKLGTAADVDCTASYATERKTLADTCRTTPSGTGCTVAINNCNANPFGDACDAVAFADAQEPYCLKSENAWHADCNTLAEASSGADTVKQARNDICLDNLAIVTGTSSSDVAAGASLFNTVCAGATSVDGTTRTIDTEQLAHCIDDENAWHANCDTLDANTPAVQQARYDVCVANGAITGATAGTAVAGASFFDTICDSETATDGTTVVAARETYCETDATAWQDNCQSFVDATNADVIAARARVCFANEEINKGGGSTPIAEGYSIFSADCNDMTSSESVAIADARRTYCEVAANSWRAACDTYATENTVADARTSVCRANGAIFIGSSDADKRHNVDADASLFNARCNGRALSGGGATVADAQMAYCEIDGNSWQGNCNTFASATGGENDVTEARSNICAANGAIVTGTPANDVAAGA